MSVRAQAERWRATIKCVSQVAELRRGILMSALSSMAFEGLEVDEHEAERILDEVLNGPPLIFDSNDA